ncbi:MAG: zinc ribbon domain-containing protein [Nitrospirae bacterium YQR-1]
MAWECPNCKRTGPDRIETCLCGYNKVTKENIKPIPQKQCPYCFTAMDIRATVCPSCRNNIVVAKKSKLAANYGSIIGAILIVFFIIGVIFSGFKDDTKANITQNSQAQLPEKVSKTKEQITNERRLFAVKYEKELLLKGLNVVIYLSTDKLEIEGDREDVMVIEYPLFSRPWAYQFANNKQTLFALNSVGIKAVELRREYNLFDRYKDVWNIDTKNGYVKEGGISEHLREQRFREVLN